MKSSSTILSNLLQNKDNSIDLIEGRRVLKLEAEALHTLSEFLDNSFIKAAEIINTISGRTIVTGIGKSGHVARKIASTLSSTGTSALFIHPAEASHGDLGMISTDDAVIALSVSGETCELINILEYTRRWSLPLIAITQNKQSTLAEIATVTLTLPKLEEACPIGLAPTTSSTMMMALGDALAVTLMKHRSFSLTDFGALHPGGSLGQKLRRIEDIMHTGDRLPLILDTNTMKEALLMMTSKGFGCTGVIDQQNQLIGIITDGDLRRHIDAHFLEMSISEVMTRHPLTVEKHMMAQEALAILNKFKKNFLLVVDKKGNYEKLIGIVHLHDFLRANIV